MVYAEYGEAPHSIIYEEIKTTKNRDGSAQIKEYEIVYADNEQFFDFYFRLYDDMTRAINGEMVFVPNIHTIFDNEVAIVAYIHRLDVTEEAARLMKSLRVETITDLLKSKIQTAGSMRQLLKTAEKKFTSAKSLNYNQMQTQEKIATKLMEHGMLIQFDSKVEGCAVDLYRFNPSIGLKMSKLLSYVADIEQVVGVSGVRVLAPIPNTSLIGFEVPRAVRTFPEVIPPQDQENPFNLAIGVDIMGDPYYFDITKAPHMLIAGATGSGKSVFLNSVISQLAQIENLDLHLFDPKLVELSRFAKEKNTVQYYSAVEDIYLALEGLVEEMNERYITLSKAGARNIQEAGGMRYKVVVIDEFGDLTVGNKSEGKLNFSKEISKNILLLAQKARACGIHLIIATQRPSVDIITGSIKANFPTKVAFRTAKEIDSRVLLDAPGAEKLLGKGDMLFSSDEGEIRLQGFLI
jgi:DNA segregation ATPase FtsK/SpoIIIE-like protein